MTNKIQVPERKPSAWELEQKSKPVKKVIRNNFPVAKNKQGMGSNKLDNNN